MYPSKRHREISVRFDAPGTNRELELGHASQCRDEFETIHEG